MRPEIRARFVGREFKWMSPEMENTFATTPPLKSLKYIVVTGPSAQEGFVTGRPDNSCVGRVVCTFPPQKDDGTCTYGFQPETASRDSLASCYGRCTEPEKQPTLGMTAIDQVCDSGLSSTCLYHQQRVETR